MFLWKFEKMKSGENTIEFEGQNLNHLATLTLVSLHSDDSHNSISYYLSKILATFYEAIVIILYRSVNDFSNR